MSRKFYPPKQDPPRTENDAKRVLEYERKARPKGSWEREWHPLARLCFCMTVLAGLVVAGRVVGMTMGLDVVSLIFAAWAAGPFVPLAVISITRRDVWKVQALLLSVTLFIGAILNYAFGFVDKDAQGGLIIIFAPMYYGWPAAGVAWFISLWIGPRQNA